MYQQCRRHYKIAQVRFILHLCEAELHMLLSSQAAAENLGYTRHCEDLNPAM